MIFLIYLNNFHHAWELVINVLSTFKNSFGSLFEALFILSIHVLFLCNFIPIHRLRYFIQDGVIEWIEIGTIRWAAIFVDE